MTYKRSNVQLYVPFLPHPRQGDNVDCSRFQLIDIISVTAHESLVDPHRRIKLLGTLRLYVGRYCVVENPCHCSITHGVRSNVKIPPLYLPAAASSRVVSIVGISLSLVRSLTRELSTSYRRRSRATFSPTRTPPRDSRTLSSRRFGIYS